MTAGQRPTKLILSLDSAWEIIIDDILLDSQTLPKPAALNATLGYRGLIDTGTSFLAGPSDVVGAILQKISPSPVNPLLGPSSIPCDIAVDITFVFGGKQFPVDPRDFAGDTNTVTNCTSAGLFGADLGTGGWVIGDPFLKSNLVAFYFGNLTNPSVDPPRIGLLSTVPSNADELFSSVVSAAEATGGQFEISSVLAPTGTFQATETNSVGVLQNDPGAAVGDSAPPSAGGVSKNEVNYLMNTTKQHFTWWILGIFAVVISL